MAQEIDYKDLLRRYMAHIYSEEMDTYTFGLGDGFSQQEIEVLDRMSTDVIQKDTKYNKTPVQI